MPVGTDALERLTLKLQRKDWLAICAAPDSLQSNKQRMIRQCPKVDGKRISMGDNVYKPNFCLYIIFRANHQFTHFYGTDRYVGITSPTTIARRFCRYASSSNMTPQNMPGNHVPVAAHPNLEYSFYQSTSQLYSFIICQPQNVPFYFTIAVMH